jgi:hypothetical protein
VNIEKVKAHIVQCRRLAGETSITGIAIALFAMASETEAVMAAFEGGAQTLNRAGSYVEGVVVSSLPAPASLPSPSPQSEPSPEPPAGQTCPATGSG